MIKRTINEEIIILLLQQVKIGDKSDVTKNISLSIFIAQIICIIVVLKVF